MSTGSPHPLVSVLIPLYNHEPFIEQTLESIIADSYPNKELIVLDDGSKDASFIRAHQWHDSYAHRFNGRFEVHTRENRGVSATLNELFTLSRGEYIAYVSSDDYLLPGGIAARLEYLQRNPDRMLVVGDYVPVDYNGKILMESGIEGLFKGNRRRLLNDRLLSYEIVFNWCLAGPIYMGRRELYKQNNAYDETLAVEDWDFCLRLVANHQLGFIDHPVAAYRVRPDESTRRQEQTIAQRIRFDASMQRTVEKNLNLFKGIKRAYLYFQKVKYYGILERLHGRDSTTAFLARKTGRVMVVTLKACYELWARLILASKPNLPA